MKKRQEVYDLYWYFAYERQNIFFKKMNGEPSPWTNDPILQEYKFCNSYRVNDRVSQYLLKNVIYNSKKYSDEDMLFRIVLFKLFNKLSASCSSVKLLLQEDNNIIKTNDISVNIFFIQILFVQQKYNLIELQAFYRSYYLYFFASYKKTY